MKFGETLYRRSIPQWAAYNVNYNEIKQLIKRRTTKGIAEPLPIPGTSTHRWRELEDELFVVLKAQHDNISLFLRSKNGEIERRLMHLEKQVRGAQRIIEQQREKQSISQPRRHHKLLQEAEQIGEDIQALSRFAAVQKTAFRKILKKYRKWTGSLELQTRMDNEVFASGHLNLDFVHPLERLSIQTRLITDILEGSIRQGSMATPPVVRTSSFASAAPTASSAAQITEASGKGELVFDAALVTVPFGKSAGCATYWIHPDNLEEAHVLLLRHMHNLSKPPVPSRQNSTASIYSADVSGEHKATDANIHVVFLDNAQRFLQDQSANKLSKIAVSGRWSQSSEAVITLSDLASWGSKSDTLCIKKKDLSKAIGRTSAPASERKASSAAAWNVLRVQNYLSEHRDVKYLGQLCLSRSRYTGPSNSLQVGTWATLDTGIVIGACQEDSIGQPYTDADSGEVFPHAVLEVRWEFARTPEVVRAFDASHLAERVSDFSLEALVVHTIDKTLKPPSWRSSLEKDIRKMPILGRAGKGRAVGRVAGVSSGTSSTDEPSDSVFSAPAAQSSVTSEGSQEGSAAEAFSPTVSKSTSSSHKKPSRPQPSSPPRSTQRYWNEFDDGDSDVNPDDAYAIYVDPDESFPGVETVSRVFGAMQESFAQAKSKLMSMLALHPKLPRATHPTERTRLLIDTQLATDSSDSDTTPTLSASPVRAHKWTNERPFSPVYGRSDSAHHLHHTLTRRQTVLERTYLQFYSGLFILAYVLLFMSAVILGVGRKKARLEVEAGAICGIVAAEMCATVSIILVCMRRMPLGIVHWGTVAVATTGIVIVGVALLVGVVETIHLN